MNATSIDILRSSISIQPLFATRRATELHATAIKSPPPRNRPRWSATRSHKAARGASEGVFQKPSPSRRFQTPPLLEASSKSKYSRHHLRYVVFVAFKVHTASSKRIQAGTARSCPTCRTTVAARSESRDPTALVRDLLCLPSLSVGWTGWNNPPCAMSFFSSF